MTGRASKQVEGRRGDGEVYEKSLEVRHFLVVPYPEEPELAPSWAAGVGRDETMKEKVSYGGGWMYNRRWPGAQNGNPG
jgi:hypothetical protein